MKKLLIALALGVTSAQAGDANSPNAWEAMFRAAGGGGGYCAQTGQCTNPQKWDRATKEQCLDLWANPNNLSCNGPCTAADFRRRDVANGGWFLPILSVSQLSLRESVIRARGVAHNDP